ncbi:MAG: hypothetical protein DRO13_02515 [Thermoprotei archaeon]|nr:MAG: hypothetical protein DRO13_02515 [Thermoprotei archaeon]
MRYVVAAMRASFYSYMCELKNNWGFAFFMVFWPYLMAFFMYGLGTMLGSIEEYSVKMNVANPMLYIVASSSIMMSSIGIVDAIAREMIRHRWLGTLPYIMASPPRFIVYATAGPIPVAMFSSLVSVTSVLPVVALLEGLTGLIKMFIVLAMIYLAMLPLVGIGVVAAGISLLAGEESNIAGSLTPFIILVSGVFYPQSILPYVLQVVGRAFPLIYVVEAAKVLATYEHLPLRFLYTTVGVLTAMSFLYNTVTSPILLAAEKKVLRRGVYEE